VLDTSYTNEGELESHMFLPLMNDTLCNHTMLNM